MLICFLDFCTFNRNNYCILRNVSLAKRFSLNIFGSDDCLLLKVLAKESEVQQKKKLEESKILKKDK